MPILYMFYVDRLYFLLLLILVFPSLLFILISSNPVLKKIKGHCPDTAAHYCFIMAVLLILMLASVSSSKVMDTKFNYRPHHFSTYGGLGVPAIVMLSQVNKPLCVIRCVHTE